MAEHNKTLQENPLFFRYGGIVLSCLADIQGDISRPIILFPPTVSGAAPTPPAGKNKSPDRHGDASGDDHTHDNEPDNSAGDDQSSDAATEALEYRELQSSLLSYADPRQVAFINKTITRLRRTLQEEAHTLPSSIAVVPGGNSSSMMESGSGSNALPPTLRMFRDFQDALSSGNEALLEENPFYELAGSLYQLTLTAMKNRFIEEQKRGIEAPPRPIRVVRSLRHIWTSRESMSTFSQKITETLGRALSLGKLLLGIILFIGSTLTTAKGVNDLLQTDGVIALIGEAIVGPENENIRLGLSLFSGVLLSSIILDYKDRIFRGIAEVGKVFGGIVKAYRFNPRWLTITTFLTLFSIWTNYDGIVLIISKQNDLTAQWEMIQDRVTGALGKQPQAGDDLNQRIASPETLEDLAVLLKARSVEAVKKFEKVPEDERFGAASSGVARKGPRYWGKYFAIHGGFVPGKKDVTTSLGRRGRRLSRNIDNMLRRSPLDLATSLASKVALIEKQYSDHLGETRSKVQQKMMRLEDMLKINDWTLEEISGTFKLESYHVNEIVQQIVADLESNKQAFSQAAIALDTLAKQQIELLRQVDQAGGLKNSSYVIDVAIEIPPIEGIDRLRQGGIPEAQRRTLAQLKNLLLESYGVTLGGILLGLILFVAISMDLSDPIFYSAMMARWGRRDRHFLLENVARLKRWESDYVHLMRQIFSQPEMRAVLPTLPTPRQNLLKYEFYRQLEVISPAVKDADDLNPWHKLRFWFAGLFSNTRLDHVSRYNARLAAIQEFRENSKLNAPRMLNRAFPGTMDPFILGMTHFDALFATISNGLREKNSDLDQAVQKSLKLIEEMGVDADCPEPAKKVSKNPLVRIFSALLTSAFDPPAPRFPLTRTTLVWDLARSLAESRRQINVLESFTPLLELLLATRMPGLKVRLLNPLKETLGQINNGPAIAKALSVKGMEEEYERLHKGLCEVLGLSVFQGFQVNMKMLRQVIDSMEVAEFMPLFIDRTQDESYLEKRIDRLEVRLSRAAALVQSLAVDQSALIFKLTRIQRDFLTPIAGILAPLKISTALEEGLRLDDLIGEFELLERTLLVLWEPEGDKGGAPRTPTIDLDPIITLMSCEDELKAFNLLEHVTLMEKRAEVAFMKLNTMRRSLRMLDKTAINIGAKLIDIRAFAESILAKDADLQQISFDEGGEPGQKKIDFLADNRFFFRTVHMQAESIEKRLQSLLRDPRLTEPHSMKLFRQLEGNAFKLHFFMRKSMAFIDAPQSSVPPSAELARMFSKEDDPLKTIDEQARQGEQREEGILGALVDDAPQLNEEGGVQSMHPALKELAGRVRETIMEISLREWDLLKKPIPPPDSMQLIADNREAINSLTESVERTLTEVATQVTSARNEGRLHDEDAKESLRSKWQQLMVWEQDVRQILTTISKYSHIDRRVEHSGGDVLKAKRRSDQAERDRCPARLMSRRRVERTTVKSKVAFESPRGEVIQGQTRDVSTRSLCMEVDTQPKGVNQGDDGSFYLLSDRQQSRFPCRVVMISGMVVVLTMKAGYEAEFVRLIREEVVRERKNSVLAPDLPDAPKLPQDEKPKAGEGTRDG